MVNGNAEYSFAYRVILHTLAELFPRFKACADLAVLYDDAVGLLFVLVVVVIIRMQILNEVMLPCISEPRAEVSEYAPKMISMTVPVDKIREIIGSGGKTIQKICADTGAKVDIDDDGSVFISAVDSAAAYAAKKMVDDICFVPEVGKLYYGKVVRILPIGAFVEIAPGHDGMVHISKLENRRVEKVEDVLNLGDMTWVKFMGFDEKGRANFSRKDALKELENK